jgi:hypothetical protein
MKAKTPRETSSAAAPLVYWLLLVCGLAAFSALRIDELERVVPLWVGTLLGTAVGQLMAWRRVRPWLATFLVVNLMWLCPLLTLPLWSWLRDLRDSYIVAEIALMAFAPAALCGYASLTERGALAAFWFPAALWMLSILDGGEGAALVGARSWLLLGGLTVLLVGFLRAHETRRVALWQGYATERLAKPRGRAVLRRAPLRVAAQLAWVAALGAGALVLTAWIAPHLWQDEKVGKHPVSVPATTVPTETTAGAGPTCCPTETVVVEVSRRRVTEYFPLLRPHDEHVPPPPAAPACVACRDGVPVDQGVASGGTASAGAGVTYTDPRAPIVPPTGNSSLAAATPPPSVSVSAAPTAAPPPPAPLAPTAPPLQAPPPAPKPVIATAPRPAPIRVRAAPPPAIAPAATFTIDPLHWLLTMVLCALTLHLALRPLRRLMTVRHLGHPLWPEAVDQRVSNLWQLMLVGLRDAGWHAVPGEQPQDLARRIGLEGMETCATVLERVRHGVRVDADDLVAMSRAALSVYREARRHAGWAARAAALMRWPLV